MDMSIRIQQNALCYHLGVRESMGQNYNLLIYCAHQPYLVSSFSSSPSDSHLIVSCRPWRPFRRR